MNKQQKKLLHYSYDLLATRRYTIREMIKKLDAKNQKSMDVATEAELEEIMASLIKSNFLNDKLYAELYIDAEIRRKPAGVLKLKQQLKLKGIDKTIIEQAINSANLDENNLARQLLQRKLKSLRLPSSFANSLLKFNSVQSEDLVLSPKEQLKIRQKLFRYLQSNGFSSYTLANLLKSESIEFF